MLKKFFIAGFLAMALAVAPVSQAKAGDGGIPPQLFVLAPILAPIGFAMLIAKGDNPFRGVLNRNHNYYPRQQAVPHYVYPPRYIHRSRAYPAPVYVVPRYRY